MKARIKFQKYGAMKFIGHLDVMRYFQKAFCRAGIDNEYSKGYSPHQIMSFAAPLGVGLTSDAEYLDVQLLSSDEPKVMLERINSVLTEGFCVTDFHPLLEPEQNQRVVTAMSLVTTADYLVSLKDGYTIGDLQSQSDFARAFSGFYEKSNIIMEKKTKKSEKEVDIKPMIHQISFQPEKFWKIENKTAEVYQNGIKVFMRIDTGSSSNLKPELVMEAFCEDLGILFEKLAWQVHRTEIYTKDMGTGELLPLNQLDR